MTLQRHEFISYSLVIFPLSIHTLVRSYEEQMSHLARDRKLVQNSMYARKVKAGGLCLSRLPGPRQAPQRQGRVAVNGDHENSMDDSHMKIMVEDEYMLIENGRKVK
jgi:hypothetical protein